MPQPVALGYVSWDPRGYYHYHERPGGAFISKEAYMSLLRPSTAGYHGWHGYTQEYAAIAQILGPGIPTGGHLWWKTIEDIEVPTVGISPKGARQYMIEVVAMRPDGTTVVERLFQPIGKGFDVRRAEEQVEEFLRTGEAYGIEVLAEAEQYTEIGRRVAQIDWISTFGIGPLE